MKRLLFIVWALALSSCTTAPLQVEGRYAAQDGNTAIELASEGKAYAEKLGPPVLRLMMGTWSIQGKRLQITTLGETLVLEPSHRDGMITLRALNLDQCPEIRGVFELSDNYVSVDPGSSRSSQ